MRAANGQVAFGPKTYGSSGTTTESVLLTPGTYSYCLESGGFTKSGAATIGFTVSWFSGWRATIFHESFESNGILHDRARTGQRVWSGPFTIPSPHVAGNYLLSWWQCPETGTPKWTHQEQQVIITVANQPDLVIGQSGQLIDEVRLHPAGASMTTATSDDGFGLTSSTDTRQLTTRFTADAFGRLNLMRDDRWNIIRQLLYKLKNP